jgi:hypothetical protein
MQTTSYWKFAVTQCFLGTILVFCLLSADWTIYNQEEKVSDYIRNGSMYVLYTEEEIRGIQG